MPYFPRVVDPEYLNCSTIGTAIDCSQAHLVLEPVRRGLEENHCCHFCHHRLANNSSYTSHGVSPSLQSRQVFLAVVFIDDFSLPVVFVLPVFPLSMARLENCHLVAVVHLKEQLALIMLRDAIRRIMLSRRPGRFKDPYVQSGQGYTLLASIMIYNSWEYACLGCTLRVV